MTHDPWKECWIHCLSMAPLALGTPVTEETFKAWQTAKAAKKQADAVARMKAEEKKKGKGMKGCKLTC